MLKKFILFVAVMAMPSAAFAEKITVFNNTNSTIHKIFAWPQRLNPRSFNILGYPVFAGSKTEVTIDNAYGDCQFLFQFDPNDPRKSKKRSYRKLPFSTIAANICGKNIFVWLGPIPYGKVQGRP